MMRQPDGIEEIILAMTDAADPAGPAALRQELVGLGDGFARSAPAGDRHLKAYLAYHFPANLMKTYAVLREVLAARPDLLAGRREYHVLDIGCGSGAGLFGFFFALDKNGAARFDLQGIDSSPAALDQCRNIARRLGKNHPDLDVHLTQRSLEPRLERGLTGTYDAILCVNSLVEIFPAGPLDPKLTSNWLRRLSPGGLLLVIEPALKTTSRRLMALRPEILKVPGIRIVRPCLHAEPCPLLAIGTRDEWCHESLPWEPPAYLARLNRGLGREIDRLKFSYLVAARTGEAESGPPAFRVVSHRLKEKGKVKCFLCAPDGRFELYRLDRDRSGTNAGFDALGKGDIVTIEGVERRGRLFKALKQSKVTIKSSFPL